MFIMVHNLGLQIISRMALVRLSGQTSFCSDTTHLWLDEGQLHHISIILRFEVLNYISMRRVNDQTKCQLIHDLKDKAYFYRTLSGRYFKACNHQYYCLGL